MKDILLMIIIFLLSLILILNVYKVHDLTYKLDRIRKRYDNFLRGRGELDLQELLLEHSKDIEASTDKLSRMEEITDRIQNDFSEKSSGITARLNKDINTLDKKVSEKLFMLEENQKTNFDSLNEKIDLEINKIIQKQQSDINDISEDNKEFKDNLEKDTQKSIKSVNDMLAFSIQKKLLHRYNALDNQTGDLSYTLILLDQFNNGIMITSINGRESSYSYAKNIKNGKSERECSPEELEALNMILNK